jgi:hypothetical protein
LLWIIDSYEEEVAVVEHQSEIFSALFFIDVRVDVTGAFPSTVALPHHVDIPTQHTYFQKHNY